MAGTVKVTFIGDSANLKKHLKEVSDEMDKSDHAFKRVALSGSKMGGALKAITPSAQTLALGFAAATAGAVFFGKKSVDAYNASVEAQTKLSTNLLNVKGNTEANVKSIEKLAGALQKKGVVEDDAIIAGASQLATFGLQGKSIEKLTPKIADMAAQMKGTNATADDMVKINNLVGKVMTGNVGALSKYGVSLTETQKKQLKNGNEAQRAALLVEVLGQNFGNVNEALAKTPAGRIVLLKNNFGDLQEKIGGVLTKALVPMSAFLLNNVVPAFESLWNAAVMLVTGDFKGGIFGLKEDAPFIGAVFTLREALVSVWEWVQTKLWPAFLNLLPTLLQIAKTIGGVLLKAFNVFKKSVSWISKNMDKVIPVVMGLAAALGTYLVASLILSGLAAASAAVGWILLNLPILAVGAAIAIVVAAFVYAYTHFKTFRNIIDTIVRFIKTYVVPVFILLWQGIKVAFDIIVGAIEVAWGIIKPIWDLLYAIIANVIIPIIQLLWAIGSVIFKAIGDAISAMWNVIKPVLEPFIAIWEVLRSAMLSAWGWIEDNILPKIEKILGWVKSFTETLKDSIDAIREFFGLENQMLTGFAKNTDEQVKRELEGKAKETVDKIIKAGNIDAESIGQKDPNSKPAEWNPKTKKWEAKKALGGPVMAGMPYKVGEGGGAELFVPSTNGNIVNARDTRSMGATYNVQIYPQKVDLNDRDLIATLKRFESLHAA